MLAQELIKTEPSKRKQTFSRSNFSVTSCDHAIKCRAMHRDLTSRSSDAAVAVQSLAVDVAYVAVLLASRITAALPPYTVQSASSTANRRSAHPSGCSWLLVPGDSQCAASPVRPATPVDPETNSITLQH